jgi:hypothetical protein
MPQGYYTIERWTATDGAPGRWSTVLQLPFGVSFTAAESALEKLDRAGFFRIVQMQRVIWAEKHGSAVKLRKSHAASEAGLDRMRAMFERCGGVYPAAEVRAKRQKIVLLIGVDSKCFLPMRLN